MKLPVPGFVSQALPSLINNDRRVKRTPFDKKEIHGSRKSLEFKQVSEEEREALVTKILNERKQLTFRAITLILILIVLMFAILLF